MKKILITGANGHLGGTVIDFLISRVPTDAVAAMVRDVTKAEHLKAKGVAVRPGDYFDKTSLVAAFTGIDTLLFISSGSLEDRVSQHTNVIEAARASGVKHIVYTSVLKSSLDTKFTAGIDHYHTEQALLASGISYTIFRNTLYMEVLLMLLGDALHSGHWFYAAGDARANFASRVDMAEALANVLALPQAHLNKVYEITSTKAYTFEAIAEIISKITGKAITYTAVSPDAMREGLANAGVPTLYIPVMMGIAGALGTGEFDIVDPTLEKLLGRRPSDLVDYLPGLLKTI